MSEIDDLVVFTEFGKYCFWYKGKKYIHDSEEEAIAHINAIKQGEDPSPPPTPSRPLRP